MDNYRPWAMWRRLVYGSGFITTWALVGGLVYWLNFYQPPNCFDGRLNGGEVEIDAGGPCVRIPVRDVIPPQVVWVESFAITDSQYNAVAYVENRNTIAATPALEYTFTFYHNDTVVGERSGTTVLPPNSAYPIFEGRIAVDRETPITDTTLTLAPADLWLPAEGDSTQFKTVDLDFAGADTRPRLSVTLENTALTDAADIEVVATVFNEVGQPVTASETFIESFPSRSTEQVEFTWPQSIARTVRSCTIPTDVVLGIDLSGSMNNDGGDPPQPLADALSAAGSFVTALGELDQIGLVTFATDAALVQPLTDLQSNAATVLAGLRIAPAEETGFTNTSAAIDAAATELLSPRHNENARRALVLLTDGLPTAAGEADAEQAAINRASALSASGADVYVIGLGQNVNQQFIRSLATSESHAYLAPTRADLRDIYAEITAALCEVGPTKIEVIAKTKTNFAPLQ